MILALLFVSLGMARYGNIPLDQFLGHFFGSILNREIQTIDPKMLKPSLRVLTLTMLIFSYVVFSTYNAVLTSFLATREISVPVQTLDDFLKPDVKLALKAGTATYDMFRYAKEGSLFQQIYETKIKPDKLATFEGGSISVDTPESNKTLLLNLGYHLILDSNFHAFANKDPCQYIFAPFEKFLIDFSSFGVPKDSPFKNLFNYFLRQQRDSGIWRTYKQRILYSRLYESQGNNCETEDGNEVYGLKFDITLPAFIVFACGILISFGISIVEKLWSR